MGDQDPERLDPRTAELFAQLSRETEGLLVDSPSPSEIRRLGERRRTIRRTGYTAGALGIAVLATAGGLALRNGPMQGNPVVDAAATAPAPAQHSTTAPGPTPSATPSALLPTPIATATRSAQPAPTAASVAPANRTAAPGTPAPVAPSSATSVSSRPNEPAGPSATAQTPAQSSSPSPAGTTGGQPTWQTVPTNVGAGVQQDAQSTDLPQEPFSICQVDINDIAAQSRLVRHFTSGDGRVNSYAVVFGYENKDQAVSARRIMRGWYTGCAARLQADGNEATQTKALPLAIGGSAASTIDPVDGASYRTVTWGSAGTTPIEEQATIIQADNRLLWVVHNVTDRTDMGSTSNAQVWAETLLS
ncbi:hypothetical protein EDD41_3090 [Luteococcus japonicus]|uniref:Uncharacterized protein n=1 Tax=Luteococcus japonicus TaxID=33984 RepID=A0A3N1ZYI5_9ACTN|nr:hypothetical protein [Luteococcus japonicus]ROR55808.1 hypothetical protein EDD41_3090 [Luteococcus japonicus]